ncbi:MAG: aminoacyl-histidine dipeptidase [Roseburia sp.]
MSKLEELKHLGLESQKVFDYFEEICAIPHGSRNTKQISDYLVEFAKTHGLKYYQDEANNVVIIQEATPGYEGADPIIIQGHMDMVCEKESGYEIDFEREGLKLYVDGDFLRAEGTTLGGDDGIAIAYVLAIMDSPEIAHPRLEAVITVDEEIGMLGAEVIDLSMLTGNKLLNIDSDIEGHFLTSCAGGMTASTTIPVRYSTQRGLSVQVTVTGLKGGHSGSEIDKEHANANIVMGRLLKYVCDRMELGIVSLAGGLKDNAIPRECAAHLLIPSEKKEEFLGYMEELSHILKKEFAASDDGIRIETEFGAELESKILDYSAMAKVIFYLRNVPNGVQHMSAVMPGLVETSLNLGILELKEEALLAVTSVRSSVSSRKEELADRLGHIAELLGGEISVSGDYPAWEYRADSELRGTISAVYRELFDEEPIFEAIHAGLECGILSGKIDDLDCVSFGPNNYDIHTPKERLSISSTEKVWKLLKEFLKRCNG